MTSTTSIQLQEVTNKRLLKQYIYLPAQLYKSQPNWVPPIYMDEWHFHHPTLNPAMEHSLEKKWIAFRNSQPVGRIMGIIHKTYNAKHNEKTVRFFQLDCINDAVVCHALIKQVEDWGKMNGMNQIIGPYGFSDKDPQGLQVEGFEHLPLIATPTNPAYLQQLVEKESFIKKIDCISYKINVPKKIPAVYEKAHERICKNNQVKLLSFTSKKELKPWIVPVFRLVNETFTPLFGFNAMSEKEMKSMAKQYLPVLNPAFVKVVVNEKNEPVAFIVAMPDMSAGIQKAKGKIFPFAFIHILKAVKKTKQLDLLLGAIKENYRGMGLNALMGASMLKAASDKGFKTIDTHLVLETNRLMCAEYEKLGGEIYKRYRVYAKPLVNGY